MYMKRILRIGVGVRSINYALCAMELSILVNFIY